MAFHKGTATNYLTLLDDFVTFATSNHVITAAVAAGGTGYTVGDILTAVGGTFTTAATFRVDTVSGGLITGLTLIESGAYTVNPSSPVATTGGTGTGATVTVTFDSAIWTLLRETEEALSAVVAVGGTGYTVSDQLTVVGGDAPTAAVFNVDTVSAGAVLTVSLVTAGVYHVLPSNPVNTTGGTGTGATLTVTYQTVAAGTDKEIILKGIGSGTDEIFVGVRTFQPGAGAFNWELAGMTGFDVDALFKNQPGISPGRFDGATDIEQSGAYIPLNNASMDFWFFVDGRRLKAMFKVSTTYVPLYLGFGNPFGTTLEYPYPLLVMGASTDHTRIFNESQIGFSGMLDPIAAVSTDVGPGFLHQPGGGFLQVSNGHDSGSGRTTRRETGVFPACGIGLSGAPPVPEEDQFFATVFEWSDVIPVTGDPGVQLINILPSLDTGGDLTPLVPATIVQQDPLFIVLVEMDDVYWMSATTDVLTLVAEDEILIGTDTYIVFQNCNRQDRWALFALKQT